MMLVSRRANIVSVLSVWFSFSFFLHQNSFIHSLPSMPDFASQEYWDGRFSKDPKPFDWLLPAKVLFDISKEVIEAQFNNQTGYQKEIPALDERVAKSLSDPASFKRYLARPDQYANYLHFFQREMEKEGYEKTIVRYCFADSAEADEIFSRMFLGEYAGNREG